MELRNLRKKLGITQIDIATALRISFQTYSSYETERTSPSPEMLCKLADFFQVSVDEILGHNVSSDIFIDSKVVIPEYQRLFDNLTPQQQELILERMRAYDDFNRNS